MTWEGGARWRTEGHAQVSTPTASCSTVRACTCPWVSSLWRIVGVLGGVHLLILPARPPGGRSCLMCPRPVRFSCATAALRPSSWRRSVDTSMKYTTASSATTRNSLGVFPAWRRRTTVPPTAVMGQTPAAVLVRPSGSRWWSGSRWPGTSRTCWGFCRCRPSQYRVSGRT